MAGLLRVKQAAELLGVSPRALRRAIQGGQVKAVRLGWLRVPRSEVERLLGGSLATLVGRPGKEAEAE